MSQLQNKTAIVTGAGSGIGEATARRLSREGARLALGDVNLSELERVCAEIKAAGGEAHALQVDVSDLASVEGFFKSALEKLGSLDIAVNNAGIAGQVAIITDADVENFDRVIAIDLRGVWLCMREAAKIMKAQGTGGAIVNTSSTLGLVGAPGSGAYVAAKHGVVGLTKSAANELGVFGIRVNAVCPGIIATNLMSSSNISKGQVEGTAAQHPLGRVGLAAEVADAMLWLSSAASSFVTGTAIAVDGGWTSS